MICFYNSLPFHFCVFQQLFWMVSKIIPKSNKIFPFAVFRVSQMDMVSSTSFFRIRQVEDEIKSIRGAKSRSELISETLKLLGYYVHIFFSDSYGNINDPLSS